MALVPQKSGHILASRSQEGAQDMPDIPYTMLVSGGRQRTRPRPAPSLLKVRPCQLIYLASYDAFGHSYDREPQEEPRSPLVPVFAMSPFLHFDVSRVVLYRRLARLDKVCKL